MLWAGTPVVGSSVVVMGRDSSCREFRCRDGQGLQLSGVPLS